MGNYIHNRIEIDGETFFDAHDLFAIRNANRSKYGNPKDRWLYENDPDCVTFIRDTIAKILARYDEEEEV